MAATKTKQATGTAEVVRSYFDALARRDPNAWRDHHAPDATAHVAGRFDRTGPEDIAEAFSELWSSFPDLETEVSDLLVDGERAAVRWRMRGTFAGSEPLDGVEPTGGRIDIEGIDFVWVRDGRIVRVEAVLDSMSIPRQLGLLPAPGSSAEQRMAKAFNLRTRLASRLTRELERVADGVWSLEGWPGRCRVYFIEEDDGVTMFDAGGRTMTNAVARAAANLGGLKRIVLGHGHTDHRGTAPHLGVPVLCHPDEVLDAEGSGGFRYWGDGLPKLPFGTRQLHLMLHRHAWDGGPVKISGTVSEGDDVAGFTVVHLPGHAPGQIGLWRERDRLALSSDCFYTLGNRAEDTPPHLPMYVYNLDTEQARASIRKLAALEPREAWPGHAKPVTGDVRAQLEHAADTT